MQNRHPQRINFDSSSTGLSTPAASSTMPRCVFPSKDEKPAANNAIPITIGAAFPKNGTSRSPNCAGAVIAAPVGCKRLIRDIHSSGIPVTQIVRKQDISISSVVADYDACGYDTVKYLVSKGCKAIGLINGSTDLTPYRDRYKGYQRAMKEEDLQKRWASKLPRC